jgi:endonuclease/exonuclease/phosphatase family metal-dependent hydrolase
MTHFKVMTWNVENLFHAGSDAGPKTLEEYERKLKSLAEIILEHDPDVLAMQEIGDLETFADLVSRLEGRYLHTQLSSYPDPRGIRVGFLSKLAIESHEDIITFPEGGFLKVTGQDTDKHVTQITRMGRGGLQILVKPIPSLSIHLINAHLKSKLLSFPGANDRSRFEPKDENERARVAGLALLKRTAEAIALRVKANALLGDTVQQGLILLGDMNDVPSAATTQILQGPPGSEIGTPGFVRRDEGDNTRLFNLAPLIAEERRYSRINQNNKELIDHIFVSQELFSNRLRKLPQVDSHVDAIALPSIDNNPDLRRGKPGSDHAPVTAVFDL